METTTVTIDVDDSSETIELPEALLSYFAEDEQTAASTAADLLVVDCTHRLHGQVHHVEGEPDERTVALEAAMRERFEDRFGTSFAELTGHQH